MAYTRSELSKIEELKRKATFSVPKYLESKSDELFNLVNQKQVATFLAHQMGVKNIDGERLNDFIVELVEAQAIVECENTIEYNEQMMIDRACY